MIYVGKNEWERFKRNDVLKTPLQGNLEIYEAIKDPYRREHCICVECVNITDGIVTWRRTPADVISLPKHEFLQLLYEGRRAFIVQDRPVINSCIAFVCGGDIKPKKLKYTQAVDSDWVGLMLIEVE